MAADKSVRSKSAASGSSRKASNKASNKTPSHRSSTFS